MRSGFEAEESIDYSGIEDHERLLCIFKNMTQSRPCLWSEVAIPRFFGLSGIDLEFFHSNLVDRNGTTKVELNSSDPKIRIGIDTEYANSACAWEVTRTLLHEIIHAELAAYAKSKGEDYLDYAEHFEFYRNDKSLGHNAMADLYRGRISESLKSVFGEIYTEEQYQAMAWTGLSELTVVRLDGTTYTIAISQAWTSMSNLERDAIRTTLSDLEINCYDPCD